MRVRVSEVSLYLCPVTARQPPPNPPPPEVRGGRGPPAVSGSAVPPRNTESYGQFISRLFTPLCRVTSLRQRPGDIRILLPNNPRQHRTSHLQKDVLPYALCWGLCPVSTALASISRMDSISTSYEYLEYVLTEDRGETL